MSQFTSLPTGLVLFPITPKATGSLPRWFRTHFFLAGIDAPWARPLAWWNQRELCPWFQQLQDQPLSTVQQKQQQIESNVCHCNCANKCNVFKCILEVGLSFFTMNAIGSCSVTLLSLWRGKIYLLGKNPAKIKSNATQGRSSKKVFPLFWQRMSIKV